MEPHQARALRRAHPAGTGHPARPVVRQPAPGARGSVRPLGRVLRHLLRLHRRGGRGARPDGGAPACAAVRLEGSTAEASRSSFPRQDRWERWASSARWAPPAIRCTPARSPPRRSGSIRATSGAHASTLRLPRRSSSPGCGRRCARSASGPSSRPSRSSSASGRRWASSITCFRSSIRPYSSWPSARRIWCPRWRGDPHLPPGLVVEGELPPPDRLAPLGGPLWLKADAVHGPRRSPQPRAPGRGRRRRARGARSLAPRTTGGCWCRDTCPAPGSACSS